MHDTHAQTRKQIILEGIGNEFPKPGTEGPTAACYIAGSRDLEAR